MEAECTHRGKPSVVAGCIELLEGHGADDDLVRALGGPHADLVLSGREGGRDGYWPRVWGCRGLLYAWDPAAVPAVMRATADPAWRVREMAAKVVARQCPEEALSAIVVMMEDPVPRVRAAAERAVARLYRHSCH